MIKDKYVLKAFQSVKREIFVDPSYQNLAYSDQPLPIGLGQTISQPTTVLFMLQLLNVFPENNVLEIGTGSGYNTALLAYLAKSVVTFERHKELTEKARSNLNCLKLDNIFAIREYGGSKKIYEHKRIMVIGK